MAESTLGVTEASSPGKFLHTWSRSIGSTTREETATYMAEYPLATYTAAATMRANTANSHLLAIQGDGTNYVRVRRITIVPANILSTASTLEIQVLRTSTAGSGGTTVNARAFDPGDTSPYAGSVLSLPTSKGSEGDLLKRFRLGIPASNPITNSVEWKEEDNSKPMIVGNSTANGLAIKVIPSAATELDVEVEFVVTPYL
jgi:hypothetical protein